MRFKVEWTQEDVEATLRQTLQENGFRIPNDQQFRWHHRPRLRVTIEVEPAGAGLPQKTVETVLEEHKLTPPAPPPEKTQFDDIDPSLLPSGVNIELLKQLERQAAKERNKK